MAKIPINGSFFLLSRRSYRVAVENARLQSSSGASVMSKALESGSMAGTEVAAGAQQKEIFWMRDPKTGNWIPETHFGDVDVADLRDKFLPKKEKR